MIIAASFVALSTIVGTGCKRKGCTQSCAANYDAKAKKDDGSCTGCTDAAANNYCSSAVVDNGSCTYPKITVVGAGNDGDVTGAGGSASNTHTWTNNQSRAELNMDITAASGGSFRVVVKDANGVQVLDETLTVGIGDDSLTKCSATGASGTWTVTITLTDFSGDGSFTLSQGC